MQTKDRLKGAIIGHIIGDCLGAFNEFKVRENMDSTGDYVTKENLFTRKDVFGHEYGCFTDDSSMTLCTFQSLVDFPDINIQYTKSLFKDWWKKGYWSSVDHCFDIGGTTASALNGKINIDPRTNAGNGSLMRISAVAMYLYYRGLHDDTIYDRRRRIVADFSKITHVNQVCIDTCDVYCSILEMIMHGASKYDLVATYSILAGISKMTRDNIKSSGYVIHSFEAAMWAFLTTDYFETGAYLAANLGDDSDTVAAIYGAVAGAYYGIKSIPIYLIAPIKKLSNINSLMEAAARKW